MIFENIYDFLENQGFQIEDIIVLESENQLIFRNKESGVFLFAADKAVDKNCSVLATQSKGGYWTLGKVVDFF